MASDLLDDDAEVNCPNCGQYTEGADVCPNCGALLKRSSEFEGFNEDDSALDEDV